MFFNFRIFVIEDIIRLFLISLMIVIACFRFIVVGNIFFFNLIDLLNFNVHHKIMILLY
jgi:hypothetical protein